MADSIIENLITKLSFDFDEDQIEAFDASLESAVKGLTAVVAGATAAAAAIFAFTKSIAGANDELGKFAQRIGVDAGALKELGFVAELNGGSIDSMNSSLENLGRIASEAARGLGPGIEAFGILGLSVTDANGNLKPTEDLFLDVADAVSKLNTQAEKSEFAQKLGIGGDLILALEQGSGAIRQQREEARELGDVLSDADTGAAADFNDGMLRLTSIVKGLSTAIGTKLMKQITPMIEGFVDWFKINKEIIKQNLTVFLNKTIEVLRGFFNIGVRIVGVVDGLVQSMGGWKNAIIAVTALIVAMNASALLMPILMLASGIAILLMLEDIQKFAEGSDSAIGNLTEDFPGLQQAIRDTLAVLKFSAGGWELVFTNFNELIEDTIWWIKELGKLFAQGFMQGPIAQIQGGIEKIQGAFDKIINNARSLEIVQEIRGAVSVLGGNSGQGQARQEGLSTGLLQSSHATTNNTTSNTPVTININGGDTEEVKRVVTGVLTEQYSGAETNLKTQVGY